MKSRASPLPAEWRRGNLARCVRQVATRLPRFPENAKGATFEFYWLLEDAAAGVRASSAERVACRWLSVARGAEIATVDRRPGIATGDRLSQPSFAREEALLQDKFRRAVGERASIRGFGRAGGVRKSGSGGA